MGPLFESPPRLLLKSGLQPLARYGTHQETKSRKPEQIIHLTQDWSGLRRGYYLSQTRMNVQGTLLNSCLGPLARYGTHQETMSGRLEQVYLPSDSRLDLPGSFYAWKSSSQMSELCSACQCQGCLPLAGFHH